MLRDDLLSRRIYFSPLVKTPRTDHLAEFSFFLTANYGQGWSDDDAVYIANRESPPEWLKCLSKGLSCLPSYIAEVIFSPRVDQGKRGNPQARDFT